MYNLNYFFLFAFTFPFGDSASISNTISEILQKMHHDGTFCEDFYKFACGTDDYIKEDTYENVLIKMHKNRSEKPEALEMFMKFYGSCMDYRINFNYRKRMEKGLFFNLTK